MFVLSRLKPQSCVINIVRPILFLAFFSPRLSPKHNKNIHPTRARARRYTLIGLNGEKLCLTNRALVTIGRALISSADLLLMSNILDILGIDAATRVMRILKAWTRERCIAALATEAASTPW